MGWSCSAAASKTMEALAAYAEARGFGTANSVSLDAFFEGDGIEHDDGAITGSVFAGSLGGHAHTQQARIEADGRISSMPQLDGPRFFAWLDGQPQWSKVKAANLSKARVAGAPITAPVRVEDMGGQGLALVGDDAELIFSSVDITEKEIAAIAAALNNQGPLLIALRDMVRYITCGDHQEIKNPYARPVVVQALKAIQLATGYQGNWMDAEQSVDDPIASRRAASRPR